MVANVGERRLFVGGLGPSVTRDDVRAQLARFGDVSSVEIVSRLNELGSPGKTFAYVNITLSEGDLRRCLSALNRTAWKGGTLRVQVARESFLHRLAKERLQAQAKQEQQHPDGTAAGPGMSPGKTRGPEFHMKAVPGTEVPGHKDWVVSKFGRVLPILHLRSQNRRKILKYDPSKYCHNLKKFEQDITNPVSISDLTWKLEGGDDVMSKKRQGQFPAFRSCPPKRVKVEGNHCSSSKPVGCPELASPASPNLAKQPDGQKAKSRSAELPASVFPKHKNDQRPEVRLLHPSESPVVRSKNSMSDDDIDSDEELKAMIAEEKKSQKAIFQETHSAASASFEVVSSDFQPNSGVKHKSLKASCSNGTAHLAEDDQEYDSGDTDEIIAGGKIGDKSKDKQKSSPEKKSKQTEVFLKNRTNCISHATKTRKSSSSNKRESGTRTKPITKRLSSVSPESENDESEEDLDYESMMTNCYRLDLTLADLEKLAKEDSERMGGNAKCTKQPLPSSQDIGSGQRAKKAPNKGSQCINPEDILASLLEGEEKISNPNPPNENKLKSKFQAFRGVGALFGEEAPKKPFKNDGTTTQVKGQNPVQQEAPPGSSMRNQAFNSNACSSDEISPPQNGRQARGADSLPWCAGPLPRRRLAIGDQQGNGLSPSSSSECETALLGTKKTLSLHAEPYRAGLGSDSGHGAAEMGDAKQERRTSVTLDSPLGPESRHVPASLKTHSEKCPTLSVGRDRASSRGRGRGKDPKESFEGETGCRPPFTLTDTISPQKKSQDNQKRLAALEERRREVQLQKQLVHSALANLDGQSQQASKPTHIVFGSDCEDEAEEDDSQKPLVGNGIKRDLTSKSSGKLFESSEDEEPETDDDEARFQIKPQFEGKAGKKLMSLQAHFGADERFRMDARFLESESEEEEKEVKTAEMAEEEELIAEKKKNLEVLKTILHGGHQAPKPSKEETAAKQFRNIVRYDPTRLDHATFERKVPPEEKESKAKRRKKREEAEKLPEVSKDLYHTVAADLKERFRATAPEPAMGAGPATPWNEMPEEEEVASAVVPGAPDPPPGHGDFTFSFFGPDVREVKEEPYKSEARPQGRMAWQQDPRFQDSSSEEEEEEEPEPVEGSKEAAEPEEAPAPGRPARRFFFFCENDERLSEGPGSFWQGSRNLPSREDWESRTLVLLQDCRKKHKAARRKAKS